MEQQQDGTAKRERRAAMLSQVQAGIIATLDANAERNRAAAALKAQAVIDAVEAFQEQAVFLVSGQETMARWMRNHAANIIEAAK